MESKSGGKIQRKRTRLAAKPYSRATTSSTRETGSSSSGHRSSADTNPSLFQRVSSSLLGFVTPSWLTGYWTTEKSDKRPLARDDTPPPTNEEDRPHDVVDAEMEGVAVTQSVESKGTPFSSQQPLGTSTPVDDFNNRFKGCTDDASDVSMATTSVSMIPQVDNAEYRNKVSGSNLSKLNERSSAKPWTSTVSSTPRSGSRPQQPGKNLQRPSFNSSYFGSPSIPGRESPVGPFASPFYPGRTTYGGASAQRSTSSKPINSPHQVYHPIRRRVKPKQASSSINSGFGVTSAAAKQILETLEKMSTPLSDAKKIPLSPAASPLVFNPTKRARTSLRPGPPVAPRAVLTYVSIANTRQTSMFEEERERTRKVSTTRKDPDVSTPSTAKFSVQSTFRFGVPNNISTPPPPSKSIVDISNPGSGGGGKMKSKKKSAVHASNKEDEENEMLEEVDLPNIALPLAKGRMPSFNFMAPSSKSSSKSSFSMSQSPKQVTSTPATLDKPNVQFHFSSPIFKEGLTAESQSGVAKTFTFSSPKPATAVAPSSSSSPMQFSFSPPSTSTLKRKETKNVVEEEASFGGGLKPAKELKKGSCLEFLGIVAGKSSTDTSANNKKPVIGFGDKFQKEAGTWNCCSCLLDNKPTAKTCTACMAAKPKASNDSKPIGLKQDSVDSSAQTGSISPSKSETMTSSKTCTTHLQSSNLNRTSTPPIGFGDKCKQEPGSWNCNNCCLLNNKSARDTCIACAGKRPQTTDSIKPQISLAEKFKPQEGSWNCEECLVDNKKESLKCVACATAKPGPTSQSTSLGKEQSSISLLQKLAPPAGSWTCDACLVQNKSTDAKCVACSSSKPANTSGSTSSLLDKFAPPAGSWSCDTCLIQNKSLDAKCVSCGSAKPGNKPETKSTFGFGDKFKGPAGSWTCDTCLITNQKSSSKCVACGTSQPGCAPSLKAPPASAFKFGGNLTQSSSKENSSSTFKFGGAASPSTGGFSAASTGGFSAASPSTGGFSFGGPSEQSKPVIGGFIFGKQTPESSTNKTSAISETSKVAESVNPGVKSSEAPTFQLGKSSSSSLEKPEASGGFKFGQKSEKAPVVSGGFSFGQSSKTTSTEKPTNSALKTGKSQGTTGGLTFGNPSSTTAKTDSSSSSSSSTFVFGAKSNDTNSLAKSDAILFGNTSEKGSLKEASSTAFQLKAGAAKTGFSFGSKNTLSVDNKDAGSVFGGTNKLAEKVTVNNNDVNKPATGVAFQFGAGTESTSSAPFVFSGQPKEASGAKPSATFSFGKKNSSGQDEAGIGAPPAKVGAFSFGNDKPQEPASTTNTCLLPAFTFSAKPNAAPPAASATEQPTFNFGQNPNQTAPAFGGFGTAVNNSTAPALGNSVNSTTGGFNFNSSSSNNGGGFNFGNTAPKFGATSSTPTFSATVNPVAPVSTFGGQSNSVTGGTGFGMANSNSVSFGGAGANNTPAPAFGSTAPPTNGPGFQFNSGSNATKSSSSNSFQFGQQNNSVPVFQFGAKNTSELPSSTPGGGFNFGSTPAPQTNNFGGFTAGNDMAFQYKASPAVNDNPFNAVSSGSSMQGRRIKKAQRRIKKT